MYIIRSSCIMSVSSTHYNVEMLLNTNYVYELYLITFLIKFQSIFFYQFICSLHVCYNSSGVVIDISAVYVVGQVFVGKIIFSLLFSSSKFIKLKQYLHVI